MGRSVVLQNDITASGPLCAIITAVTNPTTVALDTPRRGDRGCGLADHLRHRQQHHRPLATSTYVLRGASGGVTTRALVDRVSITNGGGFVTMPSGTLGSLHLTDCESSGSSWVADLGTSADLYLSGVRNASPANGTLNLRATANVKVFGAVCQVAGPVSSTAGYALGVNNPSFALDITRVMAKTAGD